MARARQMGQSCCGGEKVGRWMSAILKLLVVDRGVRRIAMTSSSLEYNLHYSSWCRPKKMTPAKVIAVSMFNGAMPNTNNNYYIHKNFKERKSLAIRKHESFEVRMKFPKKIPVIVEKFEKEVILPRLDKTKFLVPYDMTMSQFVTIIRNRLSLQSTQAFYLLVDNHCITSLSRTVGEVYWEHKDGDGFLYVNYTAQEMYG